MSMNASKCDSLAGECIQLDSYIQLNREMETQSITEKYTDMRNNFLGSEQPSFKGKTGNDESEDRIALIGYCTLFRYSSAWDKAMIIFASITALISGIFLPSTMVLFGFVLDNLVELVRQREDENCGANFTTNCSVTQEIFLSDTSNLCMWIAFAGVFQMICNYLTVGIFGLVAANQAYKIRCKFISSVLRQDIGWYDTNQTGDFAHKITADLIKVQDGIGDKLAICMISTSISIVCVICGIYYWWKLALVTLVITPVPMIAMGILARKQAAAATQEMDAYSTAGAIAEEVFSAIRTVVAFGGERKEIERYECSLAPAEKRGIQRGMMTALGGSIFWGSLLVTMALSFWYCVHLVLQDWDEENPQYTGGKFVNVFFNISIAVFYLGPMPAYFESFALSRGAASKIFKIIDRRSLIDSSSESGTKPQSLNGNISFSEVHFSYPARPSIPVLKHVNLNVEPGETVALVGPSGCGKSTIIQLILRFYDIESGKVELDGNNVKDLNVGWLRKNISLVGQEPVLFSKTIEENIRHGKPGASLEEVKKAAKLVNVHDFIESLPKKYQTLVGERGTQLSGGQKQRIAIARAIIKNPRILLLDEATSALDTESETLVQAALEKASLGRTTVVVAHRLSTIRNADRIVVLTDGKVQEVGSHYQLMKKGGTYYRLVLAQTNKADEEDNVEGLDEDKELLENETDELSSDLSLADEDLPNASSLKNLATEMEDEDESKENPPQIRLLKLAAPEWPYNLVGCISAICMGLSFLIYGVLFGHMVGLLKEEKEEIERQYVFRCVLLIMMGAISFVMNFMQIFMFSISGEKLTRRLRKMVFANIITQDIAFFDHPQNSVGSLCSRLTSDASDVQGATGSRMSTLLQSVATILGAIAMGFYFNYKMAFVVLPFIPLMLLAYYFQNLIISGQMESERLGSEAATKVAAEAIDNIRTVASLHEEEAFISAFQKSLSDTYKQSRMKSHVRGFTYAFGQSVPIFFYASILYCGSQLVAHENMDYTDVLKVMEGVLSGLSIVGQSLAFAPEYQRAKLAAVRIFKSLDLKPTVDAFSEGGRVLKDVSGVIRFHKVHFNYPSRPDVKILKGISFEIESSKTVAVVGSSGCGKSTCIQLIERLYDVNCGKVMLDDVNVKEINVANLRSHLGLVSQEPVLFSYSIAENIAYGDNSRTPNHDEVISAARQANIHNFIATLPQGYDTPVGNKGTHLSGGQKQRVAIARALLRNPKILLLDEATSALDSESEKVVQEALGAARKGRTCLIVAHRLTSIQDADKIIVIHNGKVAEQGTHKELLNRQGHYYNLQNTQNSIK